MSNPSRTVRAKSALKRAVDFRGRTAPKDYWCLVAVLIPVGLILKAALPKGPPTTLLLVAIAVPLTSATVRRLHDTGNSAWAMLWGMIPFGALIERDLMTAKSQPTLNRYGAPPGTPEGETPPVQLHRQTYLDADGNVTGRAWADDQGNIVQRD